MGRSWRRFFFPIDRESPRLFAGRLRGYRNHLTTSSRLGAFASSRLASPRPRAALSLSRDNCPFLNRAVISPYDRRVVNVNRHEVCGIRSPQRTVNVVKIRLLIDNLIADARAYPFCRKNRPRLFSYILNKKRDLHNICATNEKIRVKIEYSFPCYYTQRYE